MTRAVQLVDLDTGCVPLGLKPDDKAGALS
jgi:hypothetical protein